MSDVALPDNDLMRRASPQFIAELAAKIIEPLDVMAKYGISNDEMRLLRELPSFRNAYAEAKAFWNSDANSRERIAIKAAILVEDSLLDVYDIIKKADANLAARLDAFKQLKEIAGVDSKSQTAALANQAGQRVYISIDIGTPDPIEKEVNVPRGTTIEHEEAV